MIMLKRRIILMAGAAAMAFATASHAQELPKLEK